MNLKLMVRTDCYITTYCVYQYCLCFLLILMIRLFCSEIHHMLLDHTLLSALLDEYRPYKPTWHLSYCHTPSIPLRAPINKKHKCPRHLDSVFFFFVTCFTIDGKVPSTVYTRVIFWEKIKCVNAYFTRSKISYVIMTREKLYQTWTQCFH